MANQQPCTPRCKKSKWPGIHKAWAKKNRVSHLDLSGWFPNPVGYFICWIDWFPKAVLGVLHCVEVKSCPGSFRNKFPMAAKQITTHREEDVSWLYLSILFQVHKKYPRRNIYTYLISKHA